MKILVINGPNMNMLGIRQPEIYGHATYEDLKSMIAGEAERLGAEVSFFQSNHEGALVDAIQQAYFDRVDGMIINPAAYTHTSVALLDAVKAVGIPTVEVHVSDPDSREDFRHVSYIRAACIDHPRARAAGLSGGAAAAVRARGGQRMTRTEYDVVALGELLIDFTTQGAGADGYPLMAAHPGGAPANFLAAIARLGGRTALLSKVGADAFGTMLTGTLREVGVDTRGVVVAEDAFTTLAFVTLDARGERSFSFARKPGADTQLRAEELDLSLIEKTKAFHFGTLSLTDEPARGATQRAVTFAKERGKLITFDPNLRPPLWRSPDDAREQMLWGLGQADVVKLSDNEVGFLFGLSPREGAAYIRERFGTQLVFVTCGADGCEFANPRAQGHVDGLKGLTVTDTTGAGDIFGGCAVWRLLQSGKPPAALDEAELRGIAEFACRVAGRSTEKSGGISAITEMPDEVFMG